MASNSAAAPIWKIAAFAATLMVGLATLADGEEERTRKAMLAIGSEEFQESCAACHGTDALGRGELANKLFKASQRPQQARRTKRGHLPILESVRCHSRRYHH